MNKNFARLLAIISLILFLNSYYIFGSLFLFLFLLISIKNKLFNKLFILILVVELLTIIATYLLRRIYVINKEYIIGIVVKKSENYLIIFNGIKKYYIKIKDNNIDYFDIIKVNGYVKDFKFQTLESSFDFNKYLKNCGIFKEIDNAKVEIKIDLPFNLFQLQKRIISHFENDYTKYLMSILLFNKEINEIEISSSLLNVIYLFGSSGIYINFQRKFLKRLISIKMKEKTSDIISFCTLIPYFILNINRFTIIRYCYLSLIRFYNKYKNNNGKENFDILNESALSFLLIDPFILFNKSFYISYIFSYLINCSYLIFKKHRKIKKMILTRFLLLISFIPISISSTNSLNILSLILSLFIHESLKPIFILSQPLLFVKPILFFDNVINFSVSFLLKIDYLNFNICFPKFTEVMYSLYYSLLFLFLYFREINFNIVSKRILSLGAISLCLYLVPYPQIINYSVNFINVGQGDSTLIKYKSKNILIDTGGLIYKDIANDCLIPYLYKNKVYKLDAVFITHNDNDHCGAYDSLIKKFKVDKTYTYFDNFPVKISDLTIQNMNTYWTENSEENDKSLVLYLSLKNISFLFMGDASTVIEENLIKKSPNLRCDILKVGHHGAKTSSNESFIKMLNPKEAVISCGYNNIYHHPHDSVVDILSRNNINIRRTDLEGTITYLI